MFDWFQRLFGWLQLHITTVPVYVAAPAMVVIGALDSSLLSLPEINDYLVIMRCISDHEAVFYFPLFAALGSVLGCLLLYSIMRRGGQAVLRRRFKAEHIARVEHAYSRYGILTLAIPALLPPPMPFKIFVATAGALEYPRWRFVTTIMIARSVRYFVEGALAVYYGAQVIGWLKDDGFLIVAYTVVAGLGGLLIYLVWKRFRATRIDALTTNDVKMNDTTEATMTATSNVADSTADAKRNEGSDGE
ncbi:MAG: VTT domain-containing protein [Pyrinomonadaceae bacterium MAG19_C2-C3]|nr:VTT domain-containing protein [Pyrinomonadaceae bacterium MAG19_C2-C3]